MHKTEFRNPKWLAIVYSIFGLSCGISAYKWVQWDTLPWGYLSLIIFSTLSFLTVIEVCTSYMKLNQNTLELRSWFKYKSIEKDKIESATWAKGCAISIKLKDGNYIDIPESLMLNSQSTTNSIRAWLKK